jgi:putative transposase
MPIKRKSIRLSPENYLGKRAYFVTICCDDRQPHLAAPGTARDVLSTLLESASSSYFLLHAYCIMPDHTHLLVQGTQRGSNLTEFVRVFKLRTAFRFKKSNKQRLWEFSYYDHIVRRLKRIEDIACYIWWNPVRKGLCEEAGEYPFSGSQTIHWMDVVRSKPEVPAEWKKWPV